MVSEGIFSLCRPLFCLINNIICLTEAFQFRKPLLLSVDVSAFAIDVFFRKLSHVPMCSRLFPVFSSRRFNVSGFTLRSLTQLDLSVVQGDRY